MNQDKNILIQFVINNDRNMLNEIYVENYKELNRNLDNHLDQLKLMEMNVNDDLKRLMEV
jgi:t-SNARE complex subunit (syntaxin)